jgi:hypothetical protein
VLIIEEAGTFGDAGIRGDSGGGLEKSPVCLLMEVWEA